MQIRHCNHPLFEYLFTSTHRRNMHNCRVITTVSEYHFICMSFPWFMDAWCIHLLNIMFKFDCFPFLLWGKRWEIYIFTLLRNASFHFLFPLCPLLPGYLFFNFLSFVYLSLLFSYANFPCFLPFSILISPLSRVANALVYLPNYAT